MSKTKVPDECWVDPPKGLDHLTISDLCKMAYDNSLKHGFYGSPSSPVICNIGEKLALMHSELSEALEFARDYPGKDAKMYYENKHIGCGKPEGFGVELADAVIRICDTAGWLGIDLSAMIRVKHEFNINRPHKHGRAF